MRSTYICRRESDNGALFANEVILAIAVTNKVEDFARIINDRDTSRECIARLDVRKLDDNKAETIARIWNVAVVADIGVQLKTRSDNDKR